MGSVRFLALTSLLLLTTPLFAQEYRFYHPDPLGSNVVVTDRSGRVVQRSVHAPYGELRATVDGNRQSMAPDAESPRHLFTGQEHDPESGLTQLGARHYDPFVGKFMSAEPLWLGADTNDALAALVNTPAFLSDHAYAFNRPTLWIDPSGESPILGAIGIGTLVYSFLDPDSGLNQFGRELEGEARVDELASAGMSMLQEAPAGRVSKGAAMVINMVGKSRGGRTNGGGTTRGGGRSKDKRASAGPRERDGFVAMKSGPNIPDGEVGTQRVAEAIGRRGGLPAAIQVNGELHVPVFRTPGEARNRGSMGPGDFVATVRIKGSDPAVQVGTKGFAHRGDISSSQVVGLRRLGETFKSHASGNQESAFTGPFIRVNP